MTVAFSACGTLVGGSMLSGRMSADEPPALEQAMARFASGHDAALGEIYDLAAPAVFTFLLRMCRDRPLAEDLTQETFLRIHRARGLYRAGAAVMPWAYTIARRLFLDVVRSRRSTAGAGVPAGAGSGSTEPYEESRPGNEVAESFRSAEDLLADRELAQAVDDALAKIPETQAAAFRLLKGEGLSVAETAAIMGTTKGAVKVRAHRAYEALRGILGGQLPGTSPGRKNRGGVT